MYEFIPSGLGCKYWISIGKIRKIISKMKKKWNWCVPTPAPKRFHSLIVIVSAHH